MRSADYIKYSNRIRESFSPNYMDSAYYVGFHNGLYESMHHFDGYWFIDDILNEVELIAKWITEKNCSVCLNYEYLIEDYKRIANANEYLTCDTLIRTNINADWCRCITFAGMLINAENIECAEELFEISTNGVRPAAICSIDFSSKYCAINCMCVGYVNGKLVNLYDSTPLKEMIYHECMHAYSTFLSGDKKKRMNFNDDIVKKILRGVNNYNDKNLYNIVQLIYQFSEQELSAILAQHQIYFEDADIKTKSDFYDRLNNCKGMKCIKLANECIDFLESVRCEDETVNHLLCLYLDDESENHTTRWFISRAIKKIHKDIDKFKHNLYNLAYVACSEKLKTYIDKSFM